MDRPTFDTANLILDEIADKLDEVLDSDEFGLRFVWFCSSERDGRCSLFR